MPASDGRLAVGVIGRIHGLKGHVMVRIYSGLDERVAPGATFETARGPLTVRTSIPQPRGYLVAFEEITSRHEAERWRGVELRAPRLELDDVIWVDELFGATVVTPDGVSHGVVVSVEENPASDLMVLDTGALVPLTFVTSVLANERVEVDPPVGLFE